MSGRRLTDGTGTVDPVLLEIIAGSLASIEKEVETAIGRTARSPMIRDAHDYRAGIHDRLLRKLTGRSYSALVHPVVRDFPAETMRPGLATGGTPLRTATPAPRSSGGRGSRTKTSGRARQLPRGTRQVREGSASCPFPTMSPPSCASWPAPGGRNGSASE